MSASKPVSPSAAAAALPPLPCYLNGEFTTLDQARISVMDRGFIFGDGVYEVIPVYDGRPFRFDEHMARLERSLAELRVPNPMSRAQWQALALQVLAQHAAQGADPAANRTQLVYIQVTRGVALREHHMVEGLAPTVFVLANAMKLPPPAAREKGVACITADDFRWQKAHLKSTSLLGAVFARQMSVDADATETLMFRDGWLSEASSSNVWVVKDGRVLGAPKDNLVLEGIRYGLLETLCREAGIPFELRRIAREEVFGADELLISSATKELVPVVRLDGQAIGNGLPGPIFKTLHAAYQRAIAARAAT